MKFAAALLVCAVACAQEPFRVSVFATAGGVLHHLDREENRLKAEAAMGRLGISRIFLEGRRGDEYVPPELLRRLRDHFRGRGIEATGAIAKVPGRSFGQRQNEGYSWLNFEDPKTRQGIAGFFEENAPIFDEIIIDDFYCTADTSAISQQARGGRSWEEYRREMLVALMEPMMLAPARRANPRVRLIMKFPQWYDLFDRYGYEPARMGAAFPRLWAGTEVRNPETPRMGHVMPTEGYVNWSWLRSVSGGKLHGAWFDHIESTARNFVDQAFQSVLAGARELTLFHLGDLVEGHPGDELLASKLPELKDLARRVQGSARRGVPFYKPVNSPAGDNRFLMDYLVMAGVPVLPVAAYPSQSPVVFLGLQAAHDPRIEEKVAAHLKRGATVAVTPALLRALPALAAKAGLEVAAEPRLAVAAELEAAGARIHLSRGLEVDGAVKAGRAKVLIGSPSAPVVTSLRSGGGSLLLYNLRTFDDADYARAKELLLPPLKLGLSELPREAADALRAALLAPLGVRYSAPAGVSLYLFGNSFAVYNFHSAEEEFAVNGARRRIPANGWLWLP